MLIMSANRKRRVTATARKWHKSPHNRFKINSKQEEEKNLPAVERTARRSQAKINQTKPQAGNCNPIRSKEFVFIIAIIISLCIMAQVQGLRPQQQQVAASQFSPLVISGLNHSSSNPQKPSASAGKTQPAIEPMSRLQLNVTNRPAATRQPRKETRQADKEEEREPVGLAGANRKPRLSASKPSTPHLYRIRALTNGQLMAPLRLEHPAQMQKLTDAEPCPPRQQQPPLPPRGSLFDSAASGPIDETQDITSASAAVSASSPTLRLTSSAQRPANRTATLVQKLLSVGGDQQPAAGDDLLLPASAEFSIKTQALGPQKAAQRATSGSAPNSEQAEGNSAAEGAATDQQQQQQSILSLIDDYDSKIMTSRTKAQLSCDSGEMILRLNFSDPFKGIVYPDHNRLSPCRFFGDGHHNYELRLPLRGCGTRQAAARVFVNDVIVRFHKTLELEEDEVKTLICRYPPPLAPNPEVSTELALSPSFNHRRPNPNDGSSSQPASSINNVQIEQEGGGQQFEFVDTNGRLPAGSRLPAEPGSSGNIETLSENLVVASGVQPQEVETSNAGSGYSQQRPSKLREPPTQIDLINPRNSLVLPNSSGNLRQSPTSGASDFSLFDRLSSIELLFLISSVMFLLLLALGLATSYYCFRRHASRNSVQRASAILRRKGRRYASPSGYFGSSYRPPVLTTAGSGSVTQLDGAGSTSVARRLRGAAALQHYYGQQRAAAAAAVAGSAHRNSPLTAPSSPESDLSARGLLNGGNDNSYSPRKYLSGGYNCAFVPDSQPQPPAPQPLYSGLASRPFQPQQLPVAAGRQRGATGGGLLVNGNQILGRRDTNYGLPVGQQQLRYAHPVINRTGHQQSQFSSAFDQKQQQSQPLEYMAPIQTRPEVSFMNTNDQEPYNGGHLSRAKSLLSVRYLEPNGSLLRQPEQVSFAGGTERGRRRRQRPTDGQRMDVRNYNLLGPQGNLSTASRRLGPSIGRPFKGLAPAASKGYSSDSETEVSGNQRAGGRKPSIVLKSIEDSYITSFTETYEHEFSKSDSTKPLSLTQWRALQPPKEVPKEYRKQQPLRRKQDESEAQKRVEGTLKSSGYFETGDQCDEDDERKYQSANLRSLTELDVNFARSLLMPATTTSTTDQTPSYCEQNFAHLSEAQPPQSKLIGLRPSTSAEHLASTTSAQRTGNLKQEATSDQEASPRGVASRIEQLTRSLNLEGKSGFQVEGGTLHKLPKETKGATGSQSPDLILSPEYDYSRLDLGQRDSNLEKQSAANETPSTSYV